MNCLDQCRQFASWERVIGDERGHQFGGHFEGYWLGHVAGTSPNNLVAPDYAYIRNSSRGRCHKIFIVSGHVESSMTASGPQSRTRPINCASSFWMLRRPP